jgi:hypothetical protein
LFIADTMGVKVEMVKVDMEVEVEEVGAKVVVEEG